MRKFLLSNLLCLFLFFTIFPQTAQNQFALKLVAKFNTDIGDYGQIGFSPDGKYFFALSYKKNLQVWETENQKLLYVINGRFEYGAKFSLNGNWLAVFSEKEGQIVNIETGKILFNLNTYKEKIEFLNWSPTSQRFAVGTENFTVDVWNIESGKIENSYKIHEKKKGFWAIDDAALFTITAEFSKDEKRLLTNCNDQEAEYFDLENGKLIYAFSNSYNFIRNAKFSPDGKWIMTRSSEETVLWNAATNKFIKSFLGYISPSFSLDSRFLGLVKDSAQNITNELFDLSDQKIYLSLQKDVKIYGTIDRWSPDSKTFVTTGENGYIWNANTGNPINTFKNRVTYSFLDGYSTEDFYEYHPNGKILLVSNDKELRFFSTMRNEQLLSFPQAKRPAVWSPNGKFLLAQAKERGKIALWKVSE